MLQHGYQAHFFVIFSKVMTFLSHRHLLYICTPIFADPESLKCVHTSLVVSVCVYVTIDFQHHKSKRYKKTNTLHSPLAVLPPSTSVNLSNALLMV